MEMTGTTWGRRGRPHPLTHLSIQPPMNPPMGKGVSINHKSSNRIELSWLSQDLFDFLWFDLTPPINPPNHPPTHQTIHPPIGGEVSTDFKSSNRIKIFVQVLLNFYWFGWSTWVGMGVGGGLNGSLGMVWGWQGWCGDDRDDMGMTGTTWGWRGRQGRHHYHDKHVGSHLQFFTCVCACMCACACVCMHVDMCGDTPMPPETLTHLPPPQSHREPKTPISSISPELIEIIRFCLKILYLWTLLNSYRL